MSRHALIREVSEARYPHLVQLFGCYLHQDWPAFYPNPNAAMAEAISDYPLEQRRIVEKELSVLLKANGDNTRLRSVLQFGLGANIGFKRPKDARRFLEEVQQSLLESPRK